MAKIERCAQRTPEDPEFIFECPGCEYGHWFKTTGKSPVWTWNGDFEKPTVNPSILITPDNIRCHSFIKEGMIQFLSDCHHKLAGQTVPLPNVED